MNENAKTLWDAYGVVENYYNNEVTDIEALFGNNKEAALRCREFINRQFRSGHKERVFNIPFLDEYNESGKHLHTVSLYFLGGVLKETFAKRIPIGVKKAINSEAEWYGEREYLYSWFLTCLYHDIASCIETKIPHNVSESQKRLGFYLGKWNIKYTPFNHQPIHRGAELNCYSEELIKNYFYYMANNGETDHGIIGGYLLFDRLKKNYIERTNGRDLIENYEGRTLRWNIEHPDHFAYIADAIICHNLWTRNEGKGSAEYEQYGLDPLIIKKKVNINKWPLQFMLRLLDSLEPIKRFEGAVPREVLENIYISGNKHKIMIDWTPWLEEQMGFERWINTIKGLENWMDVQMSYDNCDGDGTCRVCILFQESELRRRD